MRLLIPLFVLAQSIPPAQAPPPVPPAPPATMAQAQARIAANDLDGAATILEGVISRNPTAFRPINLLGTVRRQQKNFDAAIALFEKSMAVNSTPVNSTPMYNIGAIYALKGDPDKAFEWLHKAKATGYVDLSFAAIDPDVASLRTDARFAGLLPSAEIFKQPFVEDVKIVREFAGEGTNDQFGWIARNIGDVDGDKVADFVTSAPSYARGANRSVTPGRIYVYSSKSGKLLWTADGAGNDSFGIGIEAAGDTNRDGIPDVIASAPGGGYAKVYSGRDGKVLLTLKAENASEGFGRHVSGAGDANGDGYADVIVGAPGNNAAGNGAGRAYVYSGKDGAVLLTLTGERAGDAFGSAVAGGAAGKGFLLVVGAPSAGPRSTGRAYVYDTLTAKPKFVVDSDETGAALGAMFLALPGDVDGDGVNDVFASDWANSAKGPSTGRVYVHSGKDGSRLHAWTGENAGDGFGTTQSVAGDVDGDGSADLVVGAWQYGGGAPGGGRVYLYSGKDGRLMKTFTCKTPFDTFGFDAVTLGDVDGDGTSDFLITSAWSAIKGYHSGRVFIVSSGVKRTR